MGFNYAIILLAAGGSTRMGEPKQLLSYKGKTLVRRMAETGLEVTDSVVVVTGSNAEKVEAEVADLKVNIVQNDEWSEGIASSICKGLSRLIDSAPSVDAVIIMVCDQPFVTATLLKEIISKKNQYGNEVVACGYGNTLGTPALFGKEIFPELLQLKGDSGAKKIILKYAESTLVVQFPMGNLDVDTREDYKSLLQKS
jgi:molybdenum cofactor cytidylyltransferase